jgi:magnesium transporter
MGIRVLNQIEDYTDELEKQIIRSSLSNKLLTSLLVLKSRLFDASKLIKADLESIREIMDGEVPELDNEEITDQPEDRSLFLLDLIETQREDLSNIINLHLAIASNNMNKQFYWLTILASILIVPTVISSIWGMNIPVPQINFWQMMLIMFIITGLSALVLKYLLPKPHLV